MTRNWRLGLLFGLLTTLFSCQAVVVGQLAGWLEPAAQEQVCDLDPRPAQADDGTARWRPREMREIRVRPLPTAEAPPCPLAPESPAPPPPQAVPSVEKASAPCPKTVRPTVKVLVLAPASSSLS